MYKIEIYEDKNGKSEIKDYIKFLRDKNNKNNKINFNKIVSYIRLLEEFGFQLGEPYIKNIDKQLWELRPLKNRILFAYVGENKIVLLNYFIKKTQKTPKREIEKAMRLLQDYMERSGI